MVVSDSLENVFQQRKPGFKIPGTNEDITFKDLSEFLAFVEKEAEFWSSLGTTDVSRAYQNLKQRIIDALSRQQTDIHFASNNLTTALTDFRPNQWPYTLSATPEAQRYAVLCKISANQAAPYLDYFRNQSFSNNNNVDYMTGVVDFVIAKHGYSILQRAAESERDALEKIKDYYLKERANLQTVSETQREEHRQAVEKIEVDHSNWSNRIEEVRTAFDQFFEGARSSFDDLMHSSEDELAQIKKTYTEYMRLKGPAQYWEEMKKQYSDEGTKWVGWTLGLSGAFMVLLMYLLFNLPSWVVTAVDTRSFIELIKGTLIVALIISVMAYLIRVFVRLAISAFHLSRDAQERLQLTHVYLSLMNENAMNGEDRGVVLQALFSRADTGLLKGDSSPTMPDAGALLAAATKLK